MMDNMQSIQLPIFVAGAAAIGVAIVGGLLTDIGPWYRDLRKPRWQPPNWAFAPAWTLIFTLCAASGVLAWTRLGPDDSGAMLLTAFAANAALNIAWSALFFRARRPDWALVELTGLWLSIVVLMIVTGRSATFAAIMLVPYLAWVSFAGVLNANVRVQHRGAQRDAGGWRKREPVGAQFRVGEYRDNGHANYTIFSIFLPVKASRTARSMRRPANSVLAIFSASAARTMAR